MKVLLLVLAMFCVQCVAIRTENPVSDDAALHNPSGKMRLYAVHVTGPLAEKNYSRPSYCVILDNDGERSLISHQGSLTKEQLRKAVRYASKWRLFFGWFAHSTAIGEGEKEETVFHMRFGDSFFLSAEEGMRQRRSYALQNTSGEDNVELTTKKLKLILNRLMDEKPEPRNGGLCNDINLEKNVPTP